MDDKAGLKVNFFPLYGNKIYLFSFFCVGLLIVLFALTKIFNIELLLRNVFLIKWLVVVFLFIAAYAHRGNNATNNDGYAFFVTRIVIAFSISLVLAIKITAFLTSKDVPLDSVNFLMLALSAYHILYNILYYFSQKKPITIEYPPFPANIKANSAFSVITTVLSILTLTFLIFAK